MTRVRWTICAMLFFATSINYVDRQVLAAFLATGIFGAIWLVWWLTHYYKPKDHHA